MNLNTLIATLQDDPYRAPIFTGTPDRTNWDRAADGAGLMLAHAALTGTDTARDMLADAICNLMHLARLTSMDFYEALSSAQQNFEAELEEDHDGTMPDAIRDTLAEWVE